MPREKIFIVVLFATMLSSILAFAAGNSDENGEVVVLKLQAKKGDVFAYNVHAELTRETGLQNAKEIPLNKVEDVLDMEFSQSCKLVKPDDTMGFDVTYGTYKLIRKVSEGDKTRKEVYTNDGLEIYDEGGLVLSKKWLEMPRSEQAETRKVFARGFSFAANPKGEIKELFKNRIFEHELPGFHALRLQQAIYYPGYPMGEETIWNWGKPVVFPEMRDHPLSGKKISTEREYEFVELREVGGISCATVSVKVKSNFEDFEEKVNFSYESVQKAHIEKSTGMAVLVEGTVETELSSSHLGRRTTTSIKGKFTITRIKDEAN